LAPVSSRAARRYARTGGYGPDLAWLRGPHRSSTMGVRRFGVDGLQEFTLRERGVMPIERLSVLQTLADALGVTVRDLRPEALAPPARAERAPGASDVDALRRVLTGHPTLPLLFTRRRAAKRVDLEARGAKPEDCPCTAPCTIGIVAAREGDRAKAREHIEEARQIAGRLGEDRNDCNAEFGPTNVEIHAVSAAVDLGDAGEAIDLAASIDATELSSERQARFLIDLAVSARAVRPCPAPPPAGRPAA
jgi:hypothetical protein